MLFAAEFMQCMHRSLFCFKQQHRSAVDTIPITVYWCDAMLTRAHLSMPAHITDFEKSFYVYNVYINQGIEL